MKAHERRRVEEWAFRQAHKKAFSEGASGEEAHAAGIKAQDAKHTELRSRKWGPVEGPPDYLPDYPPDMSRY